MALVHCDRGHYFDSSRYSACPSCNAPGADARVTRVISDAESARMSRCLGCMEPRREAGQCPVCGWKDGTQPDSPLQLPPGVMLQSQYLLGRVLGQGGFGVTYLGWELNLDMKIAVKEYLPADLATRSTAHHSVTPFSGQKKEIFEYGLAQFLEEARALARFSDVSGVVSVLNFFKANGTGYLVMPYVEGSTLKEYLAKQGGSVSYEAALHILSPVMEALSAVHDAQMLHRDISPDNVFVTRTGHVKLLDFGAARYAMGDRSQSLSVVLKPGYAPEEQYRSKGVQGPWTDVYTLGATLYRALTGQPPPDALDRLDRDDLRPPSSFGVDMPGGSEAALLRALSVRATQRFQTIAEFAAALDKPAARPAPPSPPPAPPVVVRPDGDTKDPIGLRGRAAMPEPILTPAPRPPRPQPAATSSPLEPVIATLYTVATAVVDFTTRLPGALRPAASQDANARTASIGAAGVVGVLGVLWSLGGLSAVNPWLMAIPGLNAITKLVALAAMAASAMLVLGAWLCVRDDARGPSIAWAASWATGALGVVGFSLYVAALTSSQMWALMDWNVKSSLLSQGFTATLFGIAQAALVIFLLQRRSLGSK